MEGLSETRPLQLQGESEVVVPMVVSNTSSSSLILSSSRSSDCFQFNASLAAAPSHFPPSPAALLLGTTESYDVLLRSGRDRNCTKTYHDESHHHYSSSSSNNRLLITRRDDGDDDQENKVPFSAHRCRSVLKINQCKVGYQLLPPPPTENITAASSSSSSPLVVAASPTSSSLRKRKALQPISDAAANANPDPLPIHSHVVLQNKVVKEVIMGSTNGNGSGGNWKSASWRSMLPDEAAAATPSVTNSTAGACQYDNNGEPADEKVKLPWPEEEGVWSSDPTVSRRHTLNADDDDDDPIEQQQPHLSIFRRARARRGEATDLHSISERKRRIRITEKMRELHKLVPDGTKTSKASMLDEIIRYVKHLQSRLTDKCAENIESTRRGRGMYEDATCSRGNPEPPSSSSLAAEVDRELMAMMTGIGNSYHCRTERSALEKNRKQVGRRNYNKYRDVIVRILDPEEEKLARAADEVAAMVGIGSSSSSSATEYSRVDALASYLAAAGITLLPIVSSNSNSTS